MIAKVTEPSDRTVTITMRESEARQLMYVLNRDVVFERASEPVSSLYYALHDAGLDEAL